MVIKNDKQTNNCKKSRERVPIKNTKLKMTKCESYTIPETMKRLVLTDPGDGTSVKTCKIELETNAPVPKPASGEVLVKMVAAPCNPSDYGSWRSANKKDCPRGIGNEGCGIVVATGCGVSTNFMFPVGTRVGVVEPKNNQGTFSEYVCMSASEGVFSLPDDLPLEDGASFFVNPYTTIAILEDAKAAGCKSIVHTAAASQLGQMMNKLVAEEKEGGWPAIINVVRRDEQAKLLTDLGAKHVVVTSHENWKEELKSKIEELDCTMAYDAVSGDMTGDLLECLPRRGTVKVYGGLAGKCKNITPADLVYQEKEIHGFVLAKWIRQGGTLATIRRLMCAGKKVNAGLAGGWSSSQFKDTTPENMYKDITDHLDSSITGVKLRLRFDK